MPDTSRSLQKMIPMIAGDVSVERLYKMFPHVGLSLKKHSSISANIARSMARNTCPLKSQR